MLEFFDEVITKTFESILNEFTEYLEGSCVLFCIKNYVSKNMWLHILIVG